MEIDHIFIRVSENAPEAALLKEIGLIEGSSNKHQGQGTANKRFFFQNFCLELLFIDNQDECKNQTTDQLRLFERLSTASPTISPFGVCFRPSNDGNSPAPFPSWSYKPCYLPAPLKIDVAPIDLHEPMWFYLSFATRPDKAPTDKRQPLVHPCGARQLTDVKLFTTSNKLSDAAQYANSLQMFCLISDETHRLELTFDNNEQQQERDFRPQLPLIVRF